MVRLDYEDVRVASAEVDAQILDAVSEGLGMSDIVVMSDYAKGLLSSGLARAIISRVHSSGQVVVVDPRPQNRACYGGCDDVTPNWREARELLGLPFVEPTPESVSSDRGRARPDPRLSRRADARSRRDRVLLSRWRTAVREANFGSRSVRCQRRRRHRCRDIRTSLCVRGGSCRCRGARQSCRQCRGRQVWYGNRFARRDSGLTHRYRVHSSHVASWRPWPAAFARRDTGS